MLYCLYRNTDAVVCLTVKHVLTMHKRSRRKEVLPVMKVVSTVWTVLTASKLGGPLVVWGAVTVAFRPLSSSTQLQVLRTSVAVVASLSASRTSQSRVRLSSHYCIPSRIHSERIRLLCNKVVSSFELCGGSQRNRLCASTCSYITRESVLLSWCKTVCWRGASFYHSIVRRNGRMPNIISSLDSRSCRQSRDNDLLAGQLDGDWLIVVSADVTDWQQN